MRKSCGRCGHTFDAIRRALYCSTKCRGDWKKEHPERMREYRKKNRKAHPEYSRNYARNHPEERAALARGYRRRDPERATRISSKWRSANAEKVGAHRAVWSALRSGTLDRPRRCAECGKVREVQAHHSDYSKKLAVRWLCKKCHEKAHHAESL